MATWLGRGAAALLLAATATFGSGCAGRTNKDYQPALTQPTTAVSVIAEPTWNESVRSECRPPVGWSHKPAEAQSGSQHELWISPTGATAYGVIVVKHWLMALASNEKILAEFLKNMKASDGKAELVEKTADPELGGIGGIRFVAIGQKYTLHANLMSSGNRVWIVYAGTANAMPINPAEYEIAKTARQLTVIEPAGAKP